MTWYDKLGLSTQEKKFQNKFDKERPKTRDRVSEYILDNKIMDIAGVDKFSGIIFASCPEYPHLFADDSFVYRVLAYIFVEGWQEYLLDRKETLGKLWGNNISKHGGIL